MSHVAAKKNGHRIWPENVPKLMRIGKPLVVALLLTRLTLLLGENLTMLVVLGLTATGLLLHRRACQNQGRQWFVTTICGPHPDLAGSTARAHSSTGTTASSKCGPSSPTNNNRNQSENHWMEDSHYKYSFHSSFNHHYYSQYYYSPCSFYMPSPL